MNWRTSNRRGYSPLPSRERGVSRSRLTITSHAVNHDSLQLGHLLHGVLRPFFAQATFLEAAVRHQVGSPLRPPVDVDVAAVDMPRESNGRVEALRENRRAEA